MIWLDQTKIIQSRNTVSISQVERRNGWTRAIILVRETYPNTGVYRMERLWTIHHGEGRNIGQIDAGELRIICHLVNRIGFGRDSLDNSIGHRIGVTAQLPFQLPSVSAYSELIR
jgi:hypothetical protein